MPDINGNFTQADLTALKLALVSGATRVQFRDQVIEYRSIADLQIAIQVVEAELNAASGLTTNRQVRMYATKGFTPLW